MGRGVPCHGVPRLGIFQLGNFMIPFILIIDGPVNHDCAWCGATITEGLVTHCNEPMHAECKQLAQQAWEHHEETQWQQEQPQSQP